MNLEQASGDLNDLSIEIATRMTLLMIPENLKVEADQLIWRLGCMPSGVGFEEMKSIWQYDDVEFRRLL